jgi:hypothetical protein
MSTYQEGWAAGFEAGKAFMQYASGTTSLSESMAHRGASLAPLTRKKKRKQTGKALILTNMTKPVWDKYKKGSGKKTYFDIRSQVQRSLKYKKKTKGM